MRGYRIESFGPTFEGLTLVEGADPKPGPGEILVRVRAVSLNYRDLVTVRGKYAAKPRVGLVPCSDGAGEVVEVGPGVRSFRTGDRVAGTFFSTWVDGAVTQDKLRGNRGGGVDGMLQELVVLGEDGAVRLPSHLSFEEGATLPCAALTAWAALVENGRLRAGETVLLLGTGGVSIFALQIAKLHGARVVILSSSDEKLARARAMGADETINYRTTEAWDAEVFARTGKRGVDHVVEVGGIGTLPRSLRAVRVGGHVSLIGVLSQGADVNPMPVLFKAVRLEGVYVGSRRMFESMNEAISQAGLHPVIDRTFSFEESREAYAWLESGRHFGKVVIRM